MHNREHLGSERDPRGGWEEKRRSGARVGRVLSETATGRLVPLPSAGLSVHTPTSCKVAEYHLSTLAYACTTLACRRTTCTRLHQRTYPCRYAHTHTRARAHAHCIINRFVRINPFLGSRFVSCSIAAKLTYFTCPQLPCFLSLSFFLPPPPPFLCILSLCPLSLSLCQGVALRLLEVSQMCSALPQEL